MASFSEFVVAHEDASYLAKLISLQVEEVKDLFGRGKKSQAITGISTLEVLVKTASSPLTKLAQSRNVEFSANGILESLVSLKKSISSSSDRVAIGQKLRQILNTFQQLV